MINFFSTSISLLLVITACFSEPENPPAKCVIIERHILPEKLNETSGLISYNNLIWTFNDSGGKPELYGYSLANDSIHQTITIKNAVNFDWEDIAQDENYIYVGDFGNNMGTRDSLIIYKISKSSVPKIGNANINADKIIFKYPSYTPSVFPVSWSAYDCEALIAKGDSLFVFTKDWTNGTTSIYSLPKNNGQYIARKSGTFNSQGLVTGGEYFNNELILIGYKSFIPFIWYFKNPDFNTINESEGTRIELSDLATYQTEGICFDGNRILISSEETRSPAQIIQISLK